MLKTRRHQVPHGLWVNESNEDRRQELRVSSPCPPASMVLAHAAWLRAWESRCVGHGLGQLPREQVSPAMNAALAAARVARLADNLPVWPIQQTAEKRRSVMTREICAAVEAYDCTTGLLLLHTTGKGKTVGVVHLLLTMWERSFRELVAVPAPLFVKAADLGAARRCHPLGEDEPQLLVDAAEAQLLILDDLGQDEKRDNTMMDVLDARYDAGLPTVVTSGFTRKQLSKTYGEALVRRIIETNGKGKIVNGLKDLDEK